MTEATEVVRINSVSIEDNSRGSTVSVKAYGLTMQEAEDEAVASIQRLRERLKTIGQCQAAAEDLAKALVGVLIAIEDHIQDFSDGPGDFPKEPIANAYQALAKAGVETT